MSRWLVGLLVLVVAGLIPTPQEDLAVARSGRTRTKAPQRARVSPALMMARRKVDKLVRAVKAASRADGEEVVFDLGRALRSHIRRLPKACRTRGYLSQVEKVPAPPAGARGKEPLPGFIVWMKPKGYKRCPSKPDDSSATARRRRGRAQRRRKPAKPSSCLVSYQPDRRGRLRLVASKLKSETVGLSEDQTKQSWQFTRAGMALLDLRVDTELNCTAEDPTMQESRKEVGEVLCYRQGRLKLLRSFELDGSGASSDARAWTGSLSWVKLGRPSRLYLAFDYEDEGRRGPKVHTLKIFRFKPNCGGLVQVTGAALTRLRKLDTGRKLPEKPSDHGDTPGDDDDGDE